MALTHRFKPVWLGIASITPIHAWAQSEPIGRAGGWTWPPLVIILLLLTAALYIAGLSKMYRTGARVSIRWQLVAYFALGWTSLLLALDSPIHEIGEQLFWVHMTQHEILMLVSAPLLVLSRPLVAFLWAFPVSVRDSVASVGRSRVFKRTWLAISLPSVTWLLSGTAL